jgi:hypothetical protein
MALDWSQLCILPARQSYSRQYGKMASGPEKAFCVLAFHETKPVVTVQRQFRRKYAESPPVDHHFVLGTSILLPMVVRVKVKAAVDRL